MSRTQAHPAHFSEWISHTHAQVPPHIVRVRTHLRNSYLVSHQQSPKLKEEIILLYSGLTILVFSKIFCCLQMKWAYPYCSVIATFSCLVLWKSVKWPFHFFWTTNITYKPSNEKFSDWLVDSFPNNNKHALFWHSFLLNQQSFNETNSTW